MEIKPTSAQVVVFIIFSAFSFFAPTRATGDSEQFVSIALTWLEVEELDSFKMEMKIRMEVEQSWTESGEVLRNISGDLSSSKNLLMVPVDAGESSKLWSPSELLVQNGREVVRTRSLWALSPSRRHTLRDKIAVRFGCHLDFSMYPFDHHRCQVELVPKSGTTASGLAGYKLRDDPIQKTQAAIFASPFSIVATSVALRNNSRTVPLAENGEGQVLLVKVHVRRSWSAYFGSYFIPVSSFVFISLLTLWLVYPKISVIVNFLNIILVNIFLLIHRNSLDIPKVYYMTSLSVFSFTSLVFIVLVLLVNVYVLYYIKSEEEDDEEKARRRRPHDLNIRNDIKFIPPPNTSPIIITTTTTTGANHGRRIDDDSSSGSRRDDDGESTWVLVRRKILDRIRRNSHWALLITFLLFNLVYWLLMLSIHYAQ